LDPVTVLNLLFDLVIFILGLVVYKEKKGTLPLWVAVAFGLFAVSYALTILGVGSSTILIPLRTLGYLSIIAGLILHRKH
jgi:CHASE2 domain-containing sensor protein